MAAGGWRLDVDDQNDQHTVNICEEEVYITNLVSENIENENGPGNQHTVNICEEEVYTTNLVSENLENENDPENQHTVNICEEEGYTTNSLSEILENEIENENDPENQHTVNICEEEGYTTNSLSENLENEIENENDPENRNIVISSLPRARKIVSAACRLAHVTDKNESVGILFVGDGGAGKSALINGLLGQNIATEGAGAKPVTGMSALENPYECVIQTKDSLVKVTVWDSPGIQDDHEDKRKYLRCLTDVLSRVHLIIYCINMDQRFKPSAQKALKIFAKLKPDWAHTLVALTQANKINLPVSTDEVHEFKKVIEGYKDEVRKILQQCDTPPAVISALKFLPTGYHCVTRQVPNPFYLHPKCTDWFLPFFLSCLVICSDKAQRALVEINADRINNTLPNDSTIENQPIPLPQTKKEVSKLFPDEDESYIIKLWEFIKKLLMRVLLF